MLKTHKNELILAASRENLSSGFSTRSDTNRAAEPQGIDIGLKFRVYDVKGLYYPCSENKGVNQLRNYCAYAKAGFLMLRLDYAWMQ